MLKNERQRVLISSRKAYKDGISSASNGNFSMISKDRKYVAITPSGIDRDTITDEGIVVIDMEGNVISSSLGFKPSLELKLHLDIYKNRPDVVAICHVHAQYSGIFSIIGQSPKPVLYEAARLYDCRCPIAAFALTGTEEMSNNVLKSLGETGLAALMESHGLVTVSRKGIEDAVRKAFGVEENAKAYWGMKLFLGVENIPCKNLQELDHLMELGGDKEVC